MFDLSILQDALAFLTQQSLGLQLLFILLAYALAPVCGVPITFITYVTAFIFGLKVGAPLAFIGYCLSLTLLFEGAALFKNKSLIKIPLSKLQNRFPKLSQRLSFPLIVGLASILPYLPLVALLGLTQEKRFTTYSALLLGSMPAFIIALQAGALGNGLVMGMSQNRLIFSFITLGLALMLHLWIFKKAKKNIKKT